MNQPSFTNALIHENSPYLLQHAHNPVNWMPWGEEALSLSQKTNRPLLISIGYSSCHWCHVMEAESFENVNVAKLMNENFVCIKVDREEHPEVDALYMSAVQLITGQGGWPLNCWALPDGRPFFAGTYFPKIKWMQVLEQIGSMYRSQYPKILEYAERISEGIRQQNEISMDLAQNPFQIKDLNDSVYQWKNYWDKTHGGSNRAPKFPLPVNLNFLLQYGVVQQDLESLDFVKLSLQRMSEGGIYDQIGGGFARYSTDIQWKVPHFEKMLYDNAQLIGLYAQAFAHYKEAHFEKVIHQSITFMEREMKSDFHLYYAALDADSEGVEGAFYVWKKEEILELFKDESSLVMEYYRLSEDGLWEDDNYILMRSQQPEVVAFHHSISIETLNEKVKNWEEILLNHRTKRIRPGLDDKQLLGWNALMVKALATAAMKLNNHEYKQLAIKTMEAIHTHFKNEDGAWYHSFKNGKARFDALAEDLAYLIDAHIELYQCTFEPAHLMEAEKLAKSLLNDFFDSKSGMFYVSSLKKEAVVARQIEFYDNVTPSANSVIAMSLWKLSRYLNLPDYEALSEQMLRNVQTKLLKHTESYGLWAELFLERSFKHCELVATGKGAMEAMQQVAQNYLPSTLLAASEEESELPLFHQRFQTQKLQFFLCQNQSCGLPVEDWKMLGL